MGKRVALFLILILLTGLLLLGYFLQQGRNHLITDPYLAVPAGACFIIETPDLQGFINSITSGKGILGEVGKIKELEDFNRSLKFLSDQVNKEGFKNIVNGSNAIISFHAQERGKLKGLLSMPIPHDVKMRHIKEILHQSGITSVNEINISRNTLLEVPYIVSNRMDTVYLTIDSGLLLCSTSSEMIQNIIQPGEKKDIRSEPGFLRVLLASGKNEHKIFIVFANLHDVIKPIFGDNYKYLAEKISKLAGSGGGDIYFNEDGLSVSGYAESAGTTEFLYKYKSVEPGTFHTDRVLPASTVLFETLILPAFIPRKNADSLVTEEAYSLAKALKEYTGEEITSAYIDIKENPVSDNKIFIYELKNRIQAEQIFLEELGSEYPDSNIILFQPDEQIRIPVYRTPFKGLISLLLPEFAGKADDSYVTFYDDFMITGSSYLTISRFLYDNLLNKTLENDMTYRDFEKTLPSRGVYYFYCVPGRVTAYWSEFLRDDINKALVLNKSSINKIQSAGLLFAPSNGMIYNSISLMFKEEARSESTSEWETLLDSYAATKPFFFTNHINGTKEIFVQDINNKIYLINSAGRVLWKVPLNERINGSVYMIDFYRNGKFQLLFAGKTNIHLIDRNGNYVERYPVRLRSPSTNCMSLFDYDKNGNFRLLIAGEDKLIYAYDKTGSIVKGWTPFKTSDIVRSEINYFRISGKDYLVATDDLSIYFLDRRGNRRLTLKESVKRAPGSSLRLVSGSEPSIVFTSPEGTVQHIYFNGSIKKINIKTFSDNHSFDFSDIDGDGVGEYIFLDKGILSVYDHNNTEIFTRDLGSPELGGPLNFIFSPSDNKVGVFDNKKNLIYLINKDGEVVNGFPLSGASMFSIGKLSEKSGWNLIVGGTDRFLYNYRIETEGN